MSQRRKTFIALLFVAAIVTGGCDKDDEPRSRAFRMGFASLPYGSPEGLEHVYEKLSIESDIVNHHFDNGVPWVEALDGADMPDRILQDWSFRKAKINTPHKTYVSVTPINYTHNGLALYCSGEDNMPLPSPWDSYRFNDEQVKTAYVNYCKMVIDFFQPDYFAMSIESNLLYKFRPEMWPQYLEFHEYVYRRLKALYPELPVFSTISGAPLLKGFVRKNDHILQRLAAMQLLELSDYYAISFYPPVAAYQTSGLPENTFDDLFSLSSKPVIIAETACTAESSPVRTDEGSVILAADPAKQKLFVDALLWASDRWKAKFVIWLTSRDEDPAQRSTTIDYVWHAAGLYDAEGNPRPALYSWREWFRKRIEE